MAKLESGRPILPPYQRVLKHVPKTDPAPGDGQRAHFCTMPINRSKIEGRSFSVQSLLSANDGRFG
jgi:hypothetical protein